MTTTAPPMDATARAGEEFRNDLRAPGWANAQARRMLTPEELAPLTRLSAARSLLAIAQTAVWIAVGMWVCVQGWQALTASAAGAATLADGAAGIGMLIAGLVLVGIAQHGLFILSHDAAHYRLFAQRGLNDALGRLIGMSSGVSMCTYRVTHRLHHNNLYGPEDPDTAIHGGYPRGVGYLWRKLAGDLAGLNAWKTYAYFFGAPALNEDTQRAIRPLDDTSPQLRADARQDRLLVVVFHAAAPFVAWALAGTSGLLAWFGLWLLPMVTVLQPILRLRAICEHGAVTDLASPLTAARTNRTWGSAANWIGRFVLFPHHVNYHLEHHLYPAVPHYRLPALHRLLVAKGALDGAEVRDLPDTLRRVFSPRPPRMNPGS